MKINRKPTLKDVAHLAGVSAATVSHVLNNTKKVSEKTAQRVVSAVSELGYQPNNIAKSLRVQKTHLIAVMISDITNPFFAIIVKTIEQEVAKYDYNVLLCNTDQDMEKEKLYLNILLNKRVDGIIVSAARGEGDNFKNLDRFGIPVVFLNRYPDKVRAECFVTDNFFGAYTATSHLINHGYSSIAIIAGPQNIVTGRDRLSGYKKALENYGMRVEQSLIHIADFDIESGYEAMKRIMNSKPRARAVFISNNQMTLGGYQYLKEKGYSIPEDIAIFGYDESTWGMVVEPSLSTVKQPSEELGIKSVEQIIKNIKGNKPAEKRITLLHPELVIRKSCGC